MQGQSHRRIDLGNAGATPEVSWHNGAQYYSLNQPLVSPCMLNKGYQLGVRVWEVYPLEDLEHDQLW